MKSTCARPARFPTVQFLMGGNQSFFEEEEERYAAMGGPLQVAVVDERGHGYIGGVVSKWRAANRVAVIALVRAGAARVVADAKARCFDKVLKIGCF